MNQMRATFERKNIRLPAENYRGERSYFLTLCFEGRSPYGADEKTARWLIESLRKSSCEHGFHVHAYCVMPDHLHMLVAGTAAESDLRNFANSYKQHTAFEFRRTGGKRLWQFKFFNHILRRPNAMESVAWYIWLNPVRKGLCKQPQEFPYSGSLTEAGKRLFSSYRHVEWVPPWKR